MIIETVLLVVLVPLIYFILEYINHVTKLKNYPPGPFPLPVIGNFHLMDPKTPYKTFRDLGKKYGDVFSISFGMHRIVVVNKIEAAREALVTKGNDFSGRPSNSYTMEMGTRGFKGIAFSEGPYWALTRKLAHNALKLNGDGMGNIEREIIRSSEGLKKRIEEADGKPVNVHTEYSFCTVNIICSIVFGHHYSRDDKEFADIVKFMDLGLEAFSNGDLVGFLPWLRFFPMNGIFKLKQAMKLRDPLTQRKLKEHRETFDPDNIRDFTDTLIKSSQDESVWKNAGVKGGVSDDHLEMILFDVFGAGTEPAATLFQWMTLYLLHYPLIQDRIYKEIVEVIGLDRYPELHDRKNLPFTMATIQETLRLSSFVPFGIPHKSTKDSNISGRSIPKDTMILFNLWNIHHDPDEWEHPEQFDPDRWLDDEGKCVSGRHRSFLPFSAGKRGCIGESLAKTEVFLFSSRLIKDYRIERNPNEPIPSLQGRMGITITPQPFTVIFTARDR